MKEKNLLLKYGSVVVLVALACLVIYPPSERLKGGIDLVGGHSLLFEIDTAGLDERDKINLAERVMKILRERVDPKGQRNLVWRPIGQNRLEIQMPRPPKDARIRRDEYESALAKVREMNVVRAELVEAVGKSSEERSTALNQLVRGVESRRTMFPVFETVYDKYVQAVEVGQESEDAYMALDDFENAMEQLLTTNVSIAGMMDVLGIKGTRARQEKLDAILAEHPEYRSSIENLREKHDRWAEKRGALEDPADLIRLLRGAGVLEFRILAQRDPSNRSMLQSTSAALREDVSKYVEQLHRRGPRPQPGDKYCWLPIEKIEDFCHLTPGQYSLKNFETFKENLPGGEIAEKYADTYYVLMHNTPEYCMLRADKERWSLKRAMSSVDPQTGRPTVLFTLDVRGGARFRDLTRNNIQQQLAIMLDNTAMSHATIISEIRERGQITGNFTQERVSYLVNTLEAGSLPARLKETPLAQNSIGPSLGEANRRQGLQAAVAGILAVTAFMLVYYLFAGFLADVAVAMNLLLVLAAMAFLDATFTLPGIAGLILTVGMAVDANVLIYERIREELQKGSTLRTAVKTGYEKAFSTIIDANLTTLITCVILGYLGSEEIKGFAIVLGFGIVSSMFTALFVTRLIMTTLVSKGIIKSLPMLQIIKRPNIDWLAKRKIFWPLSVVAVLGGLAIFMYDNMPNNREKLYDIEFLGGTSVQIEFKKGVDITDDALRRRVTGMEQGDTAGWLAFAAGQIENATLTSLSTSRFELTCPELSPGQIEALLRTTMEDEIEKGGVSGTGHTVSVQAKPDAQLNVASFQSSLKDVADYARKAADKLKSARIQSVGELGGEGDRGSSFEVVTVETDMRLVRAALLAAMGDDLMVDRPIQYAQVTDSAKAPNGMFPIKEGDRVLADVIGGTDVTNVARFRGGVVLVVDDLNPPQTLETIKTRLRDVRLQPEFEQYEWREQSVVGLEPGSEAGTFKKIAVMTVDENVFYFDNPTLWKQAVAQVELAQAKDALGLEKSLQKVVQFAPQVAEKTKQETIFALAVASLAIVAYIWFRFGSMLFGLAAIVALVHDVAITLGLVAISTYVAKTFIGTGLAIHDFKIDLPMIAAFLTIMGYSLNDTIVVFDRIRETRGKLTTLNPNILNTSMNQTLSRTVMTSFTTFLAVLLLYIFGGPGVHGFSFAMLCGVIVGTYSSLAIATPLLHRPVVLRTIIYIIAALGLLGIASLANSMPFLAVAGVVILIGFIAALTMDRRARLPATVAR